MNRKLRCVVITFLAVVTLGLAGTPASAGINESYPVYVPECHPVNTPPTAPCAFRPDGRDHGWYYLNGCGKTLYRENIGGDRYRDTWFMVGTDHHVYMIFQNVNASWRWEARDLGGFATTGVTVVGNFTHTPQIVVVNDIVEQAYHQNRNSSGTWSGWHTGIGEASRIVGNCYGNN